MLKRFMWVNTKQEGRVNTGFSGITCNLVGIFYLYPYKYATDAELFLVLKQNYFSSRSYGNTYQAY